MDRADSSRVTMKDGRVIQLRSLSISRGTYHGLLDGMPGPIVNGHIIRGLLDPTGRHSLDLIDHDTPTGLPRDFKNEKGKPYLIPPKTVPFDEGMGALLPDCICRGVFESSVTKHRDLDFDYSSLYLVWFQDDIPLPIDPLVLEMIRDIDWDSFAIDEADF